jgi:hypothetical protein
VSFLLNATSSPMMTRLAGAAPAERCKVRETLTGTPPEPGVFDVNIVSSDGRGGFADVWVTITVE